MKIFIGLLLFLVTFYIFFHVVMSKAYSNDSIKDVIDMYHEEISISSKCVDGEKIILIHSEKHFQGIHVGKCEEKK